MSDVIKPKRKSCCVPGCNDLLSARHRFPFRDPEICSKWIHAINHPRFSTLSTKDIYKTYYVCGRHFSQDCLVVGTKRGLKVGAIPTLFMSGYEMSRPSKRHCSVPNCNTYYSKGISIHRFPIDEKLCEKWRIALGINKPITKYMCICSKHFLPTDFMPGAANVRARLKRWVVPSRRLPHSEVVSSNGQSLDDAAINIARMDDDKVLEKAASANESSISAPRKQVKKGVCCNLDTPAISETPEIVPFDDFTDRRVPDLLNESNIEIIYLPEIKEEENNGQSKDCRSLDQQKHPTETCPDQSSRPESILPHGLSPPQDYDPSSEFVPKRMYMELKFNYMDVLRRQGLLEKRMKGCEEECKELRTENYRLTYELQKVKNLHSQMARLAEENEKCESKLFIVTGSKVMSRVNNYHPYDALK